MLGRPDLRAGPGPGPGQGRRPAGPQGEALDNCPPAPVPTAAPPYQRAFAEALFEQVPLKPLIWPVPGPEEGLHLPQVTQQAWPLTPASPRAWLPFLLPLPGPPTPPPAGAKGLSQVWYPRRPAGRGRPPLHPHPGASVGAGGQLWAGRLPTEGSRGFQVLPGPWDPSSQALSSGSHASPHWVLTALCRISHTEPNCGSIHPDSAPGVSQESITSLNRSLDLCYYGPGVSAATLAQGDGPAPEVTEHNP